MANFYNLKSLFKKKACLTLGFYCVFCSVIYGQNQVIADSLQSIYNSGRFAEKDELQLLYDLARYHADPEKSLQFSTELLHKAKVLDSSERIIGAYSQKGSALRLKGDLSQALESFFEGVKIAEKEESKGDLGILYLNIATVYVVMGDYKNTITYYKNAISILKEENDMIGYATAIENLGDLYNLSLAKPDSALLFFKQSGDIFRDLDYKLGIANNLGNVGLAYALKGKNDIAERNIGQATEMLEKLGEHYPICVYLTYMSDIYAERGDWDAAFGFAQESLDLAKQHGLKEQIGDAYLKLSELFEKRGNTTESLKYFKNHVIFRDSVSNIEKVREMANLRADFEVSQAQIEVNLLQKESEIQQLKGKRQSILNYVSVIASALILLLAIGLYHRYNFIKKTNRIIEEEKNKSEKLLRNILPEETAMELKQKGKVKAEKFESVTVLFTDFIDFTHSSSNLTPENLVRSVDYYFSKFDEVMDKHGLEKIKTIGDAYMCAGGLHGNTKDHANRMVQAAFEIGQVMNETKKIAEDYIMSYDIRIGIHTGPVVAGVVGTRKFAYDIWGDTVNVASRMESSSEPGKINISEKTYLLIKDSFDCSYRGELEVKNKGMMKMYFVNAMHDQVIETEKQSQKKIQPIKNNL